MDRREVARRIGRGGLLHHPAHPEGTALRPPGEDAVPRDPVRPDARRAGRAPPEAIARVDELAEGGRLAEHEVVAPEHRERRVADGFPGDQDRVAVAPWLLLHHDVDRREPLGPREGGDVGAAALGLEARLGARVRPEVRRERLFPRRDDEDDPLDPRRGAFAHDRIDHRRVNERQELLRHAPAEREEPRPEAPGGNDRGADGLHCFAVTETVNATSCVERGARAVTARTGAFRSPEPSTSSSSVPPSTT